MRLLRTTTPRSRYTEPLQPFPAAFSCTPESGIVEPGFSIKLLALKAGVERRRKGGIRGCGMHSFGAERRVAIVELEIRAHETAFSANPAKLQRAQDGGGMVMSRSTLNRVVAALLVAMACTFAVPAKADSAAFTTDSGPTSARLWNAATAALNTVLDWIHGLSGPHAPPVNPGRQQPPGNNKFGAGQSSDGRSVSKSTSPFL
jgi:hypothetical protein